MDITYCSKECPIGDTARKKFLTTNNSVYDAAMDFRFFIDDCAKTCSYKLEHIKIKKGVDYENI